MGFSKIVLVLPLILTACFSRTTSAPGGSSTSTAPAQPVLLNYQQVVNLSVSERAGYIKTLRQAFVEIENNQNQIAMKKGFPFPFLKFSFFTDAFAGDPGGQCIAAGWVGKFSSSSDSSCLPPSAALQDCGKGQIKCNPVFFGGDFCVTQDASATAKCDGDSMNSMEVSRKFLSDADFKARWENVADYLKAMCNANTRQQDICKIIKKHIDYMQKVTKVNLPPPVAVPAPVQTSISHPPAVTAPAKPVSPKSTVVPSGSMTVAPAGPVVEQPSVVSVDNVKQKDGTVVATPPCKNDRNKGGNSYGTCHAFCTLCTLDKMAAQQGFRTSANWIVFLSAVDRACAPINPVKSTLVLYEKTKQEGYDPLFDYRLAMKYGFCDEEHYLPYSHGETTSETNELNSVADPEWTVDSPAAFMNQFGISFENLKALYCPNGSLNRDKEDPGYSQRLEAIAAKPGTNPKFIQCARESMQMASIIKDQESCDPTIVRLDGKSNDARVKAVKQAVDLGYPASLEITGPDSSLPHCVTVTDYDLKRGEFDIINSHGETAEKGPAVYSVTPIKFSGDKRGRKIMTVWYLQCKKHGDSSN